jgi:Lipopolysaccharide kinase (Kdo/WaaP) family
MSRRHEFVRSHCTWDNGQKAVVRLMESADGDKLIQKVYGRRFAGWMLRESISIWYLSKSLEIVPRLIDFKPWKNELIMSYIPGQRALEWVLQRFGPSNLDLSEFLNCPSMERDPRIREAFSQFRKSSSAEATKLKESIRMSYAQLHSLGWQHGASNPRNVIFDGERAHIIDFDHARPSLVPGKYDYPELEQWFGISA